NIEAGVIIDTRTGDSESVLRDVANGVDAWFGNARDGFNRIDDAAAVIRLTEDGILVEALPRPSEIPIEAGDGSLDDAGVSDRPRTRRPALDDLVTLPRVRP